jgi:hypothetical protein
MAGCEESVEDEMEVGGRLTDFSVSPLGVDVVIYELRIGTPACARTSRDSAHRRA